MGLFDGFVAIGLLIAKGSFTVFLALFTACAIGFVIGVPVGVFLRAIITRIVSGVKKLLGFIKR